MTNWPTVALVGVKVKLATGSSSDTGPTEIVAKANPTKLELSVTVSMTL